MSPRRFVTALALACILTPFLCVAALAADFQVPARPHTEVVDAAGALGDGARSKLEAELQSFESTTGHHVVVYIGQTTGNVPLETWTAETANAWKVGQKGKDDGAILFVFTQDHKVRIEVGYGLESTLTDATSSQIITNTIVPRMKSGDTDGAVTAGANAMLVAIVPAYSPTYAPEATRPSRSSDPTAKLLIAVLVVLLIAMIILLQIYSNARYGYLVTREGAAAASKDMRKSWLGNFLISGGGAAGASGGFFGGGGGFSGGGFSGGSFGGGFGGGGASGGW